MEQILEKDLGIIYIKRNSRAKRIIIRKRDDNFIATAPPFLSLNEIEDTIRKLKPKLLKLSSVSKYHFVLNNNLETLTFKVILKQGVRSNFYYKLENRILNITLPNNAVIEDGEIQAKIREIIELHLRHEARLLLPILAKQLSEKYNLPYTSLSIQKSRTRWGSCSTKKKINLSYWCMMLPVHLVKFIILHELCHTIEMNHGDRFWKLLDNVTNNKAKELTLELKKHRIEF